MKNKNNIYNNKLILIKIGTIPSTISNLKLLSFLGLAVCSFTGLFLYLFIIII